MGIHGLTTFVENIPNLFHPKKLYNTKVIIDGNNLYHYLYYNYRVDFKYGGNYDQFYNKTKKFFENLARCNITPYIVFDGSYDSDDKKLRTTLTRAKERIHLAGFISHGGRGKVLPLLTSVTFVKLLNDLKIPHITCDFEADQQLVALANEWDCPLISQDSDFFIYEIHKGYIPTDFFDIDVCVDNTGQNYLDVSVYHVDNFVKHFKCADKSILPVIAALLGNDYIDASASENFFSHIKQPKARRTTSHKKPTRGKSGGKIAGLLSWLENVDTVDSAVQEILPFIKKDKRDKLVKSVKDSVAEYTDFKCDLKEYFEVENSVSQSLSDFYDNQLPNWLLHAFKNAQISSYYTMNAITLHRVILGCQVENMKSSSSHSSSLYLRRVAYGMILPKDVLLKQKSEKNQRFYAIEEYSREGKTQAKQYTEPLHDLSDGTPVPSIVDVPNLVQQEKQDFIYKVLLGQASIEKPSLSNPSDSLILAMTVHWIKQAVPKITLNHLRALLLSWFKLGAINPLEKLNDKDLSVTVSSLPSIANFVVDCSSGPLEQVVEDAVQAHGKLAKFTQPPQHTHSDPLDSSIIHAFAQFQSVCVNVIHINQLLESVFPEPNPAVLYNGFITYNMYKELIKRKDPKLYIEELLGRRSVLAMAYTKILDFIFSCTCENDFLSLEPKRKKKSKAQKTAELKSEPVSEEARGLDNETDVQSSVSDINNRFSILSAS